MRVVPGALTAALAVAAAMLLGAAVFLGAIGRSWLQPLPDPPPAPPRDLAGVPPGAPLLFETPDRFRPGDTLVNVLRRNGFQPVEAHEAASAFARVGNVRALRVNQAVLLHRDGSGRPERLRVAVSDTRTIELTRHAGDWLARETTVSMTTRRDVVRGDVEGSLWASVTAAGEAPALIEVMARVLEYDMDFSRDTRRGDRYAVVVDKRYDPTGEPREYGDVHAVRYTNRGRDIHAFRFAFPDGDSGYYDFEGNAVRRSFLAAPLAYTRISGVFTNRRLHPIHRVYRPHFGVDYAAPTGTPVRATADGVVTDAGMRGPNGNMVTLRHARGYVTKYLHLSRIPRGIRPGRPVNQRDVIGYVGSTGTSTGPHLDYRMYLRGAPVDPRAQNLPPGPPISPEHRPAFENWRDAMLRLLAEPRGAGPPAVLTEADGGS